VGIDAESRAGDTALILACRMNKLKFVELFIQRGAEVNYESRTGRTGMYRGSSSNIRVF
jgi:ankyrin repeat protein